MSMDDGCAVLSLAPGRLRSAITRANGLHLMRFDCSSIWIKGKSRTVKFGALRRSRRMIEKRNNQRNQRSSASHLKRKKMNTTEMLLAILVIIGAQILA